MADATSMRRFEGRTVAITGAGQGLGAAMATRFAAEGATVVLADVNETGVQELAAKLTAAYGVDAVGNAVDVTDSAGVNAWISKTESRFGAVDVLVNNAGIIRDGRIEDISDDDWHSVVDVSLSGAFSCARAVFPGMKSRGYGRIISFSSMSWRGNFGQANYVAAKAGIVGLTRALALEGARYGIAANAIAPGLIDTPMLRSMNERGRELLTSKIPQRRVGDTTDIAEAASFLASEAAGYITGIVLDVDGGISIGSSIR